jgi:hypothetical protein
MRKVFFKGYSPLIKSVHFTPNRAVCVQVTRRCRH